MERCCENRCLFANTVLQCTIPEATENVIPKMSNVDLFSLNLMEAQPIVQRWILDMISRANWILDSLTIVLN